MYLLDTNIISEIRKIKQNKANKNLIAWLDKVDKNTLYTNVVILMELERGILKIQRKDPIQGRNIETWYQTVIKPTFQGRIYPIDCETVSICASLHIPNPAPENDAWMASTALQHDLILVTRNVKDFNIPHLKIINPFE